MARRSFHDWPALATKAAGLIRQGTVKPLYTALADALGVPRPTLDTRFREMGITFDLLPHPDKWPAVIYQQPVSRADKSEQVTEFHGIDAAAVVKALRKGPRSLAELSEQFNRSESTLAQALDDMRAAGFGIVRQDRKVTLPKYTPPQRAQVLSDSKARHLTFAVASDPHIGSKAAQISALRGFLDLAVKKHGVQHILVPGDLTAGIRVYRGQENEVYAAAASDQLDALVNTLPQYPGVTYMMLGGNHDYSHMKTAGFNIIEAACRLREDWVYLGYDEAVVPLTADLDIALWHPSGGVPYSLSYRGQKYVEQVAQRELVKIVFGEQERPRIRFIYWGHLHVSDSFPFGPIQVTGPGCFEGRNSYLKQKGLTPTIQGIVVEAWMTDEGLIQRHVEHQYRYVEAEDDWHNAYQPALARAARVKVQPMFSLQDGKV